MPLQIDEISVSMQVLGDAPERGEAGSSRCGQSEEAEREAIVVDCVRRVLSILHAREER